MAIGLARLELTTEDPVEPDLPICDPHYHLWNFPDGRYLLDDFLSDIAGGHRVVNAVFVESRTMYKKNGPLQMRPVGETEFADGIAVQSESLKYGGMALVAGIVGFADLALGSEVEPVLEAHIAASRKRFRGVRHTCAWDASADVMAPSSGLRAKSDTSHRVAGLLLDPKFREGFACLKKYGLSFDAWVFHTQLMELVDLARTFPDTPIILNHIGAPLGIGPYAGRREEVFHEWKQGIAALASCANVFVKLGGLGMRRCGFGWHERAKPPSSTELAEAMAPYYRQCIEQFGANRCMFESNFPPDKISYSYTVLWNALKRIAADYSPEDRAFLLHDTAVKVYRLSKSTG